MKINNFLYPHNKLENKNIFQIDIFILIFYIFYFIISLSGAIFINYKLFGLELILIYFLFTFSLFFGTFITFRFKRITYKKITLKNLNIYIKFFYLLMIFLTLYSWKILINHYGSLEYIFLKAIIIRNERIGGQEQLIPTLLGYLLSIVYGIFALHLVLIERENKRKYYFRTVFLFICILLIDLSLFGRIGILYAVFCVIGYFLLYRKKMFSKRALIGFIALYGAISLPRLIRGGFDNFKGTIGVFSNSFRFSIHPIFYSLISIFIYFFSSLYALGELIRKGSIESTYGQRLFTPLYNLSARLFGNIERISLIDEPVYIPFKFNIFTIIRDIIADFNYAGIVFIPFLFGLGIGLIFKGKGIFQDALKIYMFGWLFYTPIYNAFSFGAFFFSFIFLILMSLFIRN